MIVSVNELPGAQSTENDDGTRDYTRRFQVITNSRNDGALTVRTATGIPRRGDIYATATEQDFGAVCKTVAPQQDDENPLAWEVRCQYGEQTFDADQESEPLNRPADISWSFAKHTRIAERDINSRPICNSAGDYFDPPPEIDDSRPVLVISRNEAAFSPGLALQYQDAVNSDGFFGAAAGQAKVANISAQRQVENNFVYWRVTYEIEFRREGWTLQILDRGKRIMHPPLIAPLHIAQRNAEGVAMQGMYVTDPVPLENGREIIAPTPETVKFLPIQVYKTMPFSGLGLP